MTQLSPTALEAAAKHFDPDAFAKDQHGYLMIRGETRRKRAKQAATAAITAYLAQVEKEGWVMVPADTLAAIKSMLTIEAIAPAEHGFEREKRREAWGRIEAMLSAAQNGGE